MLGEGGFRDRYVVHCCIARDLPSVGEKIIDNSSLVYDAQPLTLERRLELVRSHELIPSVRAAGQPAQDVFGAENRQGETLECTVEHRRDHEAAVPDHLRTTADEKAKLTHVLDYLHS